MLQQAIINLFNTIYTVLNSQLQSQQLISLGSYPYSHLNQLLYTTSMYMFVTTKWVSQSILLAFTLLFSSSSFHAMDEEQSRASSHVKLSHLERERSKVVVDGFCGMHGDEKMLPSWETQWGPCAIASSQLHC